MRSTVLLLPALGSGFALLHVACHPPSASADHAAPHKNTMRIAQPWPMLACTSTLVPMMANLGPRQTAKEATVADVLVVLAPGAEEIEAITVADLLVRAKQTVVVASTAATAVVTGSRGLPLAAHCQLDEVHQRTFDLVYLPGGMGSATTCRDDPRVQDLAEAQLQAGRMLALICAAPIALVPRRLCAGRDVTSFPGVRAQVESHAKRWLDQQVVVDGPLITSQAAGTALALGLALARLLAGDAVSAQVAADILAPH